MYPYGYGTLEQQNDKSERRVPEAGVDSDGVEQPHGHDTVRREQQSYEDGTADDEPPHDDRRFSWSRIHLPHLAGILPLLAMYSFRGGDRVACGGRTGIDCNALALAGAATVTIACDTRAL